MQQKILVISGDAPKWLPRARRELLPRYEQQYGDVERRLVQMQSAISESFFHKLWQFLRADDIRTVRTASVNRLLSRATGINLPGGGFPNYEWNYTFDGSPLDFGAVVHFGPCPEAALPHQNRVELVIDEEWAAIEAERPAMYTHFTRFWGGWMKKVFVGFKKPSGEIIR